METLSPLGPVFHAGTLAGNPLATAAGLAALGELSADVYRELEARARAPCRGARCGLCGSRVPAQFPVVGTLVGVVCGDIPLPVDFAGARRTDEKAFAALFHALLDEGVALAARRLRGSVRRARPRRRGDRPGRGSCRAGRSSRRRHPLTAPGPRASADTLASDAASALVAVRCRARGAGGPRSARQRVVRRDRTRSPGSSSAAARPAGGPTWWRSWSTPRPRSSGSGATVSAGAGSTCRPTRIARSRSSRARRERPRATYSASRRGARCSPRLSATPSCGSPSCR